MTAEKTDEKKLHAEGVLEENKVVIWENIEELYDNGFFGKILDNRLELAMAEACILIKRGRLTVTQEGKNMEFSDLFEHACKMDRRFPERFRVYEDLRERGLVVRTGLKFGCDHRVYERGVQLKRGPKSAKEHTKWIVYCIPEDYTCSFQELSRSVRLPHNIRAKMLWALVDNEGDITYYQVLRVKP